jgi:TonB family protein
MDENFSCALAEWHQAGQSLPSAIWLPKHYAYALWGLDRKEQAIDWYSAAVRADAYLGRGNYAARSGGGRMLNEIARALFAAWSERHAPLSATLLAEVDIDAEGRIERVKLLPSRLDARLLARVQAAVADWTFTPAMHEGRAVSLSTHLYIDVRGRPAPEGGHSFEIQYAGAGPRYLDTPAPVYPPAALSRYQEGEVLVNVEIQPDGRAGEVTVASSSGHKPLDRAAVQAISNWTFVVDRLDGSPVPTFAAIPVSFVLVGGAGQGNLPFYGEQRIGPRFTPPPVF